MADVFFRKDFNRLFNSKKILFVGDSNMRALYKDFVQLGLNHVLLGHTELRAKLENSYNGDRLMFSGPRHNGRDAAEERFLEHDRFSARYYFITKCYSEYVVQMLRAVVSNFKPHVIVFNSCIWDITRWGPKGVDVYKENIPKLMRLLRELLPSSTLFIWCTSLPVSSKSRGGFLIPQVEFLKHTLRFDIMEANLYASRVVSDYGFDVLDLHYYLRHQIHRRTKDGIHWHSEPMRHLTNLLLTHISLAWGAPLPNRFESRLLQRAKDDDYRSDVSSNLFDSRQPFFHEDFSSDHIPNANAPFFSARAIDRPSFHQSFDNHQPEQFSFNPFSVPQQPSSNEQFKIPRRSNKRRKPKKGSRGPRGHEVLVKNVPSHNKISTRNKKRN